MAVTAEEIQAWQNNPVTQEIWGGLEGWLKALKDEAVFGSVLNGDRTAENISKLVGKAEILCRIINSPQGRIDTINLAAKRAKEEGANK